MGVQKIGAAFAHVAPGRIQMRTRTKHGQWISWGILAIWFFVVALRPALARNPATELEPTYNPATVVNFFTSVADVREVALGSPLAGLHLEAKTKDKVDIYVGPSDFAEKYAMVFNKGDKIQVIGSKVKLGDADVILAREISLGKYDRAGQFVSLLTLYMRNDEGPFWAR
jgi:hypothetical protein